MSFLEKNWVPYLLIFTLAIAQYANTRNHDFAWDDVIVITENSRVQKGWSDIPELFENIKSGKTENRYGYRPISLLSFATDVEFFGVNSKASHRISILHYGILVVVVFFFLQTIFPNKKWFNFLVSVLFVVHPLHTEVVANVKSRDEVLAMSFGLAALVLFWNGLLKSSWINYTIAGACLVLAFLSKENAVVFCGVAGLLAWYRFSNISLKNWLKIGAPIAIFFAVLVAIRFFVYSGVYFQNDDFELYTKGIFLQDGFVGNPLFGIESNFLLKYWNIIFLNGLYLTKFLVPFPLVHDYGYNYLSVVGFTDLKAWLAVFVLIAMLLFLFKGLRERTIYGFGLAFYFMTASVYLHVGGLAPDIFAERFMFMPLLGLALVFVDILLRIAGYMKKSEVVVVTVVLILSSGFFAMSWNRNEAWKDNRTLLETDLSRLHDGARANYNYALLLHGLYYQSSKQEQLTMADSILKYYERTMKITDRLYPAYLDLGGAYMEFQKFDEAKKIFQKAIDKYPQISASYVQMGKYYMTHKEYDKAIPNFEKAIEMGAHGSDYYYFLAICEFNSENHQKAIEILNRGEAVDVNSGAYYALIVNLHMRLGETEKAQNALQRGLNRFPQSQDLNNLKATVSKK
ncbi:MAG: tetratricopeptide repeat protein [Flavobacteriales bacterium]|nr:tetratricopeptide repeat protein [Flavobacteriales bacterium]